MQYNIFLFQTQQKTQQFVATQYSHQKEKKTHLKQLPPKFTISTKKLKISPWQFIQYQQPVKYLKIQANTQIRQKNLQKQQRVVSNKQIYIFNMRQIHNFQYVQTCTQYQTLISLQYLLFNTRIQQQQMQTSNYNIHHTFTIKITKNEFARYQKQSLLLQTISLNICKLYYFLHACIYTNIAYAYIDTSVRVPNSVTQSIKIRILVTSSTYKDWTGEQHGLSICTLTKQKNRIYSKRANKVCLWGFEPPSPLRNQLDRVILIQNSATPPQKKILRALLIQSSKCEF
eukprot:TRINITY_DN4213_c0_g1_i3.p1 TRINITY_DN4213_c0_g1~~TRINITY_DN4213_c0_g1_i3.p1  ORF type:complete len:286 (+),score=-12.70 TRINITY_DN4213_c0_g1_i3:345-1202(+)